MKKVSIIKKVLCLFLCVIIALGATSTAVAAATVENSLESSAELQVDFSLSIIFEPIIKFFKSIINWFKNLFGHGATEITINISQNDFETTNSKITLNGTYQTTGVLDNITYSVLSYSDSENSVLESGETIIDGNNWEAEILVKPDVNTITVTGENKDGVKSSATIDVTYDAGSVYIPDVDDINVDSQTGLSYIDNVIVVVFKEDTSESKKKEIINSVNGTIVGQLNGVNQYQIQVPTSTLSQLKEKVNKLESYSAVTLAHYDSVYYDTEDAAVAPSDPWDDTVNATDWLDSDVDGSNWWLEAIEAPAAWGYDDRFSNIKIGIVDNGFDTGHEDLKIKFPTSGTKNANNKEDHGSHVAGIIGATANNNKGITGIVWNSELICVDWEPSLFQTITGRGWKTDTMIAAGLVWTVEAGAKVVNFSLGCSGNLSDDSKKFDQSTINASAQKASGYMAELLKNHDFVVVQSAGNGAKNEIGVDAVNNLWFCAVTNSNCVNYGTGRASKQGILDRILVVAAAEQISNSYRLTSFSNGGSQVDIAAPGRKVYSTVTGGTSGSYDTMSGTSMAAPIVTGVCSLVWSVNDSFTGDEVAEIVCSSTSKTAVDNTASRYATGSFPLVNAKLAVEEAIKRTDASGTVKGRFVDAVTGNTIYNVRVSLANYEGYGNLPINIGTEYSVTSGSFEKELPAGTYVFNVKSDGYISKRVEFKVTASSTTDLDNVTLSTSLAGEKIRVVLTWGDDHPEDLDSHFIGTKRDGNSYHVYYMQMGDSSVAWLDRDDTNYEGPETITIDMNNFTEFTYCVHNYSQRSAVSTDSAALSMATSGAKVEVFSGSSDEPIATYRIPTNRKGTVWNVFSMSADGTITDINSFGYESNPEMVGY